MSEETSVPTFEDLGVSENIINALKAKGFTHPTPIQVKTIPLFMNGDANIIGQARTGTGKTAAFGIPILQNITEKTGHIQAIILTPTRELAMQVSDEMATFGGLPGIGILPVYGGSPIAVQMRALNKGIDIVVGTPGRVIDLINRRKMDLSHISYFVLDEADEMLNMGFIDDIKEVLQHTPEEKRMLCFSATMPKPIMGIAKKYMGDYEMVSVESPKEEVLLTEQISIDVSPALKFEALCRVIDSDPDFYGLIFCARKDTSDEVVTKLEERGYDADVIHGDVIQEQRTRIMEKFRKHKLNILVATDVAARGIDINELTHVVNYDVPQDPESYTHRIGRTGRAGKQGIAVTLLTPADFRRFSFIRRAANADVRRARLPNADEIAAMKKAKLFDELDSVISSGFCTTPAADPFREFADTLLSETDASPQDIITSLLKAAYENRILPRADDKVIDELFEEFERSRAGRNYGGRNGRDGDRNDGGRDRNRGYGGRDRDRGYGGRDRDRGYGGRDRDRGYGGRDRDRGYGGRDRDRGYGGRDRDRSYDGRDGDRSYGGRDRDGDRGYGYGSRDRDGDKGYGYGSRDRDGEYGGRDRSFRRDEDRRNRPDRRESGDRDKKERFIKGKTFGNISHKSRDE